MLLPFPITFSSSVLSVRLLVRIFQLPSSEGPEAVPTSVFNYNPVTQVTTAQPLLLPLSLAALISTLHAWNAEGVGALGLMVFAGSLTIGLWGMWEVCLLHRLSCLYTLFEHGLSDQPDCAYMSCASMLHRLSSQAPRACPRRQVLTNERRRFSLGTKPPRRRRRSLLEEGCKSSLVHIECDGTGRCLLVTSYAARQQRYLYQPTDATHGISKCMHDVAYLDLYTS